MNQERIRTNGLLTKVLAIPIPLRRFDTDDETATKHYGISPALLEELISQGLPFKEAHAKRWYYSFDLSNIGLHLGLPSIQRFAMRTWTRTLQLSLSGKRWDASVKILPISADSVTANPLKILQIPILSHCIYAAGTVRDLLDEFSCHRFFMLPEDCRWDMDFIDRNQICECGGASKRMFFRARERGIEARQCFGLLLAAPFSTGHYWTEFKIDGEWTPFDPLLLGLLHATSRLDPQAWPTHRSNAAVLHRLCVIDSYDANGAPELDNYVDEPYVSNPLVIMDGQVLAVSLPTELLQHPAEASDRNLQPQWMQKAVG